VVLALVLACAARLEGMQGGAHPDRFDPHFRKYTKRFFGPAFDWRHFKAQGLAESGLDAAARSRNGARGIMQLMPATLALIRSRAPDHGSVDDPELNIAAGIKHNRAMWGMWDRAATPLDRRRFMFASYNAGLMTILRAQRVARRRRLDPTVWTSIETVSARVWQWRQRQTILYLRKIERFFEQLDGQRKVCRAGAGESRGYGCSTVWRLRM
jgi:membrane-bound lytic murein transglycosylase F